MAFFFNCHQIISILFHRKACSDDDSRPDQKEVGVIKRTVANEYHVEFEGEFIDIANEPAFFVFVFVCFLASFIIVDYFRCAGDIKSSHFCFIGQQ